MLSLRARVYKCALVTYVDCMIYPLSTVQKILCLFPWLRGIQQREKEHATRNDAFDSKFCGQHVTNEKRC